MKYEYLYLRIKFNKKKKHGDPSGNEENKRKIIQWRKKVSI